MTLVLSAADQKQLVTTLETLLSPLASSSPVAWFDDVMREMQTLCHGDSALLCAQHEDAGHHYSRNASALAEALDLQSGFRSGEFHFNDPHLDSGMVLRRRRSVAAFTSHMMDKLTGGTYFGSEFYNDVAVPFGAITTLGLGVRARTGEAILGINSVQSAFDPLGEDTLGLLSLVLPAFRAGFETLSRLEFARQSFASMLDTISDGTLIFSLPDVHELYRNEALRTTLAGDPERTGIEQRLLRLARGMSSLGESGTRSRPGTVPMLDEIRTARAVYVLRVSRLAPGTFSRDGAALVAVETPSPVLPSVATLRARFDLTAREAEVAIEIARGASDLALARELGISPHTVRHHVERVFEKLGVHSRKALALHLATRGGDR